MITKNSSGAALSAGYAAAVTGENRQFLAKLLLSGTELACDITRLQITKGCVGSIESFNIGNVFSNMLTAEVQNLTDNVKGLELEAQIGLLTDPDNDTWEYVTPGFFTVSEANQNTYSTIITAFGPCVSKTQGDFTSPQDKTPAQALTLANIISEIETETGCTITVDPGIDQTQTLINPMSGLKTYQALQIVAQVVGGYAIDTYDGNIAIKLYDDTVTLTAGLGLMVKLPEADEHDFEVTGVSVMTSGGPISSAANVNLATDAQWLTPAMFTAYESGIVGYTYRPATVGMTLGDPRIEGDDVIGITDLDGNTYAVPCHLVRHTYTGGFKTDIRSATASPIANDIATPGPLSPKIDDAIAKANAAEQSAQETNQYFWHTTTDTGAGAGAHITEIPQAEFLQDPANGGGNMLARSSGIAVRDGLTELASFASNLVQLGKNSLSAIIDMCASALRLTSALESDGQGYDPETWEPYDKYKQRATITSRVTSQREHTESCEIELKAAPLLNADVVDGSKVYLQSDADGFAKVGLVTDQQVLGVNNANSYVSVQAYPNDYGGSGEATLESSILIEDEIIIDYDTYDYRLAQGYFKIETIFDNADPEYTWLDAEAKIKGTKFTIEYDDIGATHSPHYLYDEFAYTPGYEDTHRIYTAGYITNSKTDMYLTIPLSKPLLGVPQLSSVTAITRQNNTYTHGSSASSAVAWSVIEVTKEIGGLRVGLRRSTTTNAINNAPVGIDLSFTFRVVNP